MASREMGAILDSALTSSSLAADTREEITENFRNTLNRGSGLMKTIRDAINTTRGKVFTSRKRLRHDALQLVKEGNSYS